MAKTLVVLAVLAGGALWMFGWPGSSPAQAGGRAVVLDPAAVRQGLGAAGGEASEVQPGQAAQRTAENKGLAQAPDAQAASAVNQANQEKRTRRRQGLDGAADVGNPVARGGGTPNTPSALPSQPDSSPEQEKLNLKVTQLPEPSLAERAARVEALLARASSLEAAGDVAGASAVLRQGMTASTSPVEVARLGFFLAALTDSPAESRRLLTNALKRGVVRDEEYELASDLLRELNRSPASSLLGLLRVEEYVVQPNDSLWELCNRTFPREFEVSPEVGLIQVLNGMSGTGLRVDQKLAVPREDLQVVVDRKNHGIVAYLGDVALVAYRVGLGKEGRTPSGEFVIEVKLTEPTWYRDGQAIPFGNPENILGTRWMGFENNPGAMGYGIHGTAHPESVGSDESMGCVRMRNEEVEELFELLARGTTVTIP